MKVGITGGQGFIGGHTVAALLAAGHEVVIFDRRWHENAEQPEGVSFMLGDVKNLVDVHELAAHVDGIVHLAAVLGTQETALHPRPAAETNIFGALNVIDAALANAIPVVNICVGNHWMLNTYSTTKTCAERLFAQFAKEAGLRVNQVRVVNAYGRGQSVAKPYGSARVRKIVPSFACRALSGDPIEVYGDGAQVSDCVHVSDVARVLVKALERAADGVVFDRVVEVGPTEHLTVLDIAKAVRHIAFGITGRKAPIVHLPMRPGEEPGARVVADTSTLALVDEHPSSFVTLADGLRDTVRWFADNVGVTWERPK